MDTSRKSTNPSIGQRPRASQGASALRNQSSPARTSSSTSNSLTSEESRARIDNARPLSQIKVQKTRQYNVLMNDGRRYYRMKANGTVMAEIKRLQRSTKLTLPRGPFARLIKELANEHGDYLFQSLALEALQEATELFMIDCLSSSYKLTRHRKRETMKSEDMQLYTDLVHDLTPLLQK